MYATDFIYDGEHLSDYHFVICSIDSDEGVKEINPGSDIVFNQISINSGYKHSLISTRYDNCISLTFDICKDPDYFNNIEITEVEYRRIFRWLNRKEFKKFRFRTGYTRKCYFNASFNITNIYVDDRLYGFRLTMYTDKPYGYGEEESVVLEASNTQKVFDVINKSDEIGSIYPTVKIEMLSSGDLTITNETYLEGYPTQIKNCSVGEVIVIDCENQIITSTKPDHICDDFNYRFFSLGSSYRNDKNEISISLPCRATITYEPIIKNIN